ncbi:hypothetical protein T484DRAFT_1860624 [Baffinella frigidus]|nr:hypothetical protein T484DRAFT_1860624 [Cryptophyta sp. CCMP2293]
MEEVLKKKQMTDLALALGYQRGEHKSQLSNVARKLKEFYTKNLAAFEARESRRDIETVEEAVGEGAEGEGRHSPAASHLQSLEAVGGEGRLCRVAAVAPPVGEVARGSEAVAARGSLEGLAALAASGPMAAVAARGILAVVAAAWALSRVAAAALTASVARGMLAALAAAWGRFRVGEVAWEAVAARGPLEPLVTLEPLALEPLALEALGLLWRGGLGLEAVEARGGAKMMR